MSSAESLQLLERYSVVILPMLVVAEQIGIPLPAVPALLGVGALAASGRASVPFVMAAIMVVALTIDLGWYELGRRRGAAVLARLCRLSPEPHRVVRETENIFARFGDRGMLIAKFVPGLTTVMPPLAGFFAVGRLRFVFYDLVGVLLWAGTWIGLGYVFTDGISLLAAELARVERALGLLVAAGLIGYVLVKYLRRRPARRAPRSARRMVGQPSVPAARAFEEPNSPSRALEPAGIS